MKTVEDALKAISELLKDYEGYYEISEEDIELMDAEDLIDKIEGQIEENGGFNVEIVYNSNAMEYLSEHDPSLEDSLNLAMEFGYKIDDLNSEILASLLASEASRQKFRYNIVPELGSLIEEAKKLL